MTRLRIATFNLENLDDHPGHEPTLEARLALLQPQLQRLDADVLCLQEVNAQRRKPAKTRRLLALEQLLAGTVYAQYNQAVTHGTTGALADVHNLVTLSRLPILHQQQVHNELVAPPSYRRVTAEPREAAAVRVNWERPILLTKLDVAGTPVTVINLHLQAPLAAAIPGQKLDAFTWRTVPGWAEGLYLATMKRAGQALETRLTIDGIFDTEPGAMIAVCGDFNAGLDEMPVRLIRGTEEDTGNGALASRALIPVERSVNPNQRFSVLHHGRPEMLDHILVSHGLLGCYRATEIHNEALGDELIGYAQVRNDPASYHAPLVAEFALPQR
ncbi:MAG: endonuclease/exonuclease/phosphatase family protein [Alphaproteobacteria bacterium]